MPIKHRKNKKNCYICIFKNSNMGATLGYSNHTRKAYFYLNLGYVF